jgi:hypothetical protein
MKKKPITASEIGKIGGKAGTGKSKVRGDSEYYRNIAKKKKKKTPHWMDCNCVCHEWFDAHAPTCPHCRPDLYPDYEIENQS